jgi:hypothetical protein
MYIRTAQFDLPCAERLTQPTASQAVLHLSTIEVEMFGLSVQSVYNASAEDGISLIFFA